MLPRNSHGGILFPQISFKLASTEQSTGMRAEYYRVSAILSVGLGVNASNRIFILPGRG